MLGCVFECGMLTKKARLWIKDKSHASILGGRLDEHAPSWQVNLICSSNVPRKTAITGVTIILTTYLPSSFISAGHVRPISCTHDVNFGFQCACDPDPSI